MAVSTDLERTNAVMLLGRGDQATVELDLKTRLVRKTFSTDNGTVAEHVNREFSYLRALSSALAEQPFLRCPEPVLADPHAGMLWMTYCQGYRLDQALANRGDEIEPHLSHIADQLALALDAYVDTFDEPYFDFTTANILYDPDDGVVSLIDLADPGIYSGYDFHEVRYDLSLGNFISSTTYHTLRPRVMWNLGYWRRQRQLTAAVTERVRAHHPIRPEITWRAQAEKYSAHANHGRWYRRAWFLTMGRLMYSWRVSALSCR